MRLLIWPPHRSSTQFSPLQLNLISSHRTAKHSYFLPLHTAVAAERSQVCSELPRRSIFDEFHADLFSPVDDIQQFVFVLPVAARSKRFLELKIPDSHSRGIIDFSCPPFESRTDRCPLLCCVASSSRTTSEKMKNYRKFRRKIKNERSNAWFLQT